MTSDMTPEELKQLIGRTEIPEEELISLPMEVPNGIKLDTDPFYVNHVEAGWVNLVRNQGACGSSYA